VTSYYNEKKKDSEYWIGFANIKRGNQAGYPCRERTKGASGLNLAERKTKVFLNVSRGGEPSERGAERGKNFTRPRDGAPSSDSAAPL